ncbi:MAG: YggS family pyridoxal phosphate-dependent enzyme [Flaviflexus sp.]|nr:YggS family pyridoxal phosphate-dependent enzyme [Flaviflexus sp.]
MTTIAERYRELADEVRELNPRARILLAAKHQSPADITRALEAGANLLGHNIIQQLVASEEALADAPAHEVHVIGHVQSNKARDAVAYAQVIETIDRVKTARRINTLCERQGVTREVYLQINSSGATTQYGIEPAEAARLADEVAELDRLRLTGLMTIGAHTDSEAEIRRSFATVRELGDKLTEAGHEITELSMGMSADWRLALTEGSTIIRVGSSVFGPRKRA